MSEFVTHSLVLEIRMSAKSRPIISVLLSLLLVISAPTLALSKVAGSPGESLPSMMDCGSMMMDQAESAASSSGTATECVSAPEMACPSGAGLIKCGVSVSLALLPGHSLGFTNNGSQPVLAAQSALYQNPFLASITPPPEHHS